MIFAATSSLQDFSGRGHVNNRLGRRFYSGLRIYRVQGIAARDRRGAQEVAEKYTSAAFSPDDLLLA